MIKKLAEKLARAVLPYLLKELVYLLEDLIQTDINNDGKVGKN